MSDLPAYQGLYNDLFSATTYLRLSGSLFFATSVILSGYTLRNRFVQVPSPPLLDRVGFWSFIGGTSCLLCLGTVLLLSPFAPKSHLVTTVISLILAISTLILEKKWRAIEAFGFVAGAAIWLVLTATPFIFPYKANQIPHTSLSTIHIVSAAIGQGLFLVACSLSILYLLLHRRLKSKIIDSIAFLPSLEKLDELIERTVFLGLGFMSVSLVTGVVLIQSERLALEASTFKITWAFSTWGWYFAAIFGRFFWGWRGKKGAELSIIGTVLIIIALFGTI